MLARAGLDGIMRFWQHVRYHHQSIILVLSKAIVAPVAVPKLKSSLPFASPALESSRIEVASRPLCSPGSLSWTWREEPALLLLDIHLFLHLLRPVNATHSLAHHLTLSVA